MHARRRSHRTIWCSAVAVLAAMATTGSCASSTGREPMTAGPSTSAARSVPPTTPHTGERYESQSSASGADGAAWEFAEGLRVRITGATRLAAGLGSRSRDDAQVTLIRIDFSYTNNGPAVNLSDGYQLPVRLLHGEARTEALVDGGYLGTSDQLTLRAPTTVEPGATVHGAGSFVVPADADVLAVLVVEPRRYTEHLFTDIQDLLEVQP